MGPKRILIVLAVIAVNGLVSTSNSSVAADESYGLAATPRNSDAQHEPETGARSELTLQYQSGEPSVESRFGTHLHGNYFQNEESSELRNVYDSGLYPYVLWRESHAAWRYPGPGTEPGAVSEIVVIDSLKSGDVRYPDFFVHTTWISTKGWCT